MEEWKEGRKSTERKEARLLKLRTAFSCAVPANCSHHIQGWHNGEYLSLRGELESWEHSCEQYLNCCQRGSKAFSVALGTDKWRLKRSKCRASGGKGFPVIEIIQEDTRTCSDWRSWVLSCDGGHSSRGWLIMWGILLWLEVGQDGLESGFLLRFSDNHPHIYDSSAGWYY